MVSETSEMLTTISLAIVAVPIALIAAVRVVRAIYNWREDQGEIIYEIRLE